MKITKWIARFSLLPEYRLLLGLFALVILTAWLTDSPKKVVTSPSFSKVHLQTCQQQISQLHLGFIETLRLVQHDNNFFVQYVIQAKDGLLWLASCDMVTGQLLHWQNALNTRHFADTYH